MTHGLTITESATGPRPVREASLAVIGLVATAAGSTAEIIADLDAQFPLNTPVLVDNIRTAISNAGDEGTLKPALEAIADQTTPILVVVRVAPDEDPEVEEANVLGGVTDDQYTGMQALLSAETIAGVRPRILGTPGLNTADVTAELVVIAKKLRAFAYAAPVGETSADVIAERDDYSARELMLIWPDTTNDFAGDAIARAMGLRARIDEEQGWHKTLSNVAMDGVTGIDRDLHFDLLDPSTPVGVLNDAEIANIMQPFMDNPMTTALIKDILETGNARYRKLVTAGQIIGAEMFFDAEDNNAADLAAGRPKFRIEYTPAAPLENPEIGLVITDYYYTGFADLLN